MRHQLAAYSPVTARSVVAGATGLGPSRGAREQLIEVLRREYSADTVALLDSGTHALQHALTLATTSGGDRPIVALPAFSCFDLATAAVGADVRCILYDIDPVTLAPDERSLETALAHGARVAVIAPLYGVPVDWETLEGIAARYGALLIEDAAQGHGAAWKGRALGSLGRLSILSFSRGKGWTGGSGGAVMWRAGLQPPVSGLTGGAMDGFRNSVSLAAQWLLGRPTLYGLPRSIPGLALGETRYHAPSGVGLIPRSAAAALLMNRVPALREAEARKKSAKRMLAAVGDIPGLQTIRVSPDAVAGYIRLPVRLRGGLGALRQPAHAIRQGIAPSYPCVLSDLPAIAPRLVVARDMPGARDLAVELVTLPTHSLQSERDLERALELLRDR